MISKHHAPSLPVIPGGSFYVEYVNKYTVKGKGEGNKLRAHGVLHRDSGGKRVNTPVPAGLCTDIFYMYKAYTEERTAG